MNFFQFLFGTTPSATENTPDASTQVSHINQEMYKKSFELNERNKTLSLLRKIDEIILGSITNPKEIAQQVTSVLVTDIDFQIVGIFLYDKKKKMLTNLVFSEATQVTGQQSRRSYITEIPLANTANPVVQAILNRSLKISPTLDGLVVSPPSPEGIQETDVKSVLVYPVIVRNELIGAMVIGLKDVEEAISEYRKDLMSRLAQVIGIAMDNALLYNEVQDANRRLIRLDQLKDEFVSLASHELRTPMTAIKSYLWMALAGKGGDLNEKQKYYIDRSYLSVERLIRLVNDMLNVSRIDSGRVTLEPAAVTLEKLVADVITDVTPRAQELGIVVKINQPASPLPQVLADPDKMKEVLFNLIGNSLKFTPKDGTVTVSFKQNGDTLETTVADTGSGLAADAIPQLFQKFSMIADSYAADTPIQGTGLGLYICKSIVELHKGKIWVISEGPGKGAQFIFSLPVFHEGDLQKLQAASGGEAKEKVEIVHTGI